MSALVRSTHSSRLERYLGTAQVEELSRSMLGWYGPPIAVAGVPGSVWATGDGDFRGPIRAGQLAHALDFAENRLRRIVRNFARRQSRVAGAGFSSLSDLISEATVGGKAREFPFQKNGSAGTTERTNSLWGLGASPAAGANASAAPGGDAPTDATTGAFPFENPTGGDTQHWVGGWLTASVASNSLLLYDRIFQVNKTMASTGTESVTGVPTRYQSSTPGNADYAAGNFIFVEVGGTALAATAHNWTVCLYRNQAGTDAQTMPSLVGVSSNVVRALDHPLRQWFAPLAAGDTGAMDLNQMQCSASVATGVINFVIGHPIAWMPVPLLNVICAVDGIYTAFNLIRIFDDAALAFLEVTKPSGSATTYTGSFRTVAG